MNESLTKIAATAATTTAVTAAIALNASSSVLAATFNYSLQTNTGYSIQGSFSYDEMMAPAIISEEGPGTTNALQSLSVSFFNPSNNLIGSYNPVVNSVSNYDFLDFNFDTSTQNLFGAFDVGADTFIPGQNYITNVFEPPRVELTQPGNTLYLYQNSVSASGEVIGELIDTVNLTADQIQVTEAQPVPEPSSVLGLLAFGGMLGGSALKKKLAFFNKGDRA